MTPLEQLRATGASVSRGPGPTLHVELPPGADLARAIAWLAEHGDAIGDEVPDAVSGFSSQRSCAKCGTLVDADDASWLCGCGGNDELGN